MFSKITIQKILIRCGKFYEGCFSVCTVQQQLLYCCHDFSEAPTSSEQAAEILRSTMLLQMQY